LIIPFLTACGQDNVPQYTAEVLVKVTPTEKLLSPSITTVNATSASETTAVASPAVSASIQFSTVSVVSPAAVTSTGPFPTATPVPATPFPTVSHLSDPQKDPPIGSPNIGLMVTTAASAPPTTPFVAATVPTSAPLTGKLVYSDYEGNITLINPDGSGKKIVGHGKNPLFSPDGQRVAFTVELPATQNAYYGGDRIVSVNLDGSGRQEMCTSKPNYGFELLRWSPRGRFIALIELLQAVEGDPGYVSMCPIASSKPNDPLTMRQGAIRWIYDWTVDGENALWQTQENGSNDFALYYGDPDKFGDGAIKLTNGQYLSPYGMQGDPRRSYHNARFSPDGKTIAVVGEKIFFLSVPGQKSPLEGKVLNGFQTFQDIAWSPDGRALAFLNVETDASSNSKALLKIVEVGPDQMPGKVISIDANISQFDWSRQ